MIFLDSEKFSSLFGIQKESKLRLLLQNASSRIITTKFGHVTLHSHPVSYGIIFKLYVGLLYHFQDTEW